MNYETSKVIGTASGFRVFDGGDLRSSTGRGQLAAKYEQFRQFRMASDGLFSLMNDTVEVRQVNARTLEFQLPLRNPSRDRRNTSGVLQTDHYASAWKTKQLIVDNQKMISRSLDPLELQSYPGYAAVTLNDGSQGVVLNNSVYANWKMTDIYAENIYKAAKILKGAEFISKKYHKYKIYIPTEPDAKFEDFRNHIWDPLTRLRNMMMQTFTLANFGRNQKDFHFVGSIDFTRNLIKAVSTLAADATVKKIENYTISKVGGITINQHLFIGNKFEAYQPYSTTSPYYPTVGTAPQFIDANEAFDFSGFDGLMVFKGSIGVAFGAPYRYEKINPTDGQLIMSNSFYAPRATADTSSGAPAGVVPAIELYDRSAVAIKAYPRRKGTVAGKTGGTDLLEQITSWNITVPLASADSKDVTNSTCRDKIVAAIAATTHNTHIDTNTWNTVKFDTTRTSKLLTTSYQEFSIQSAIGSSVASTDPTDVIRIRYVAT